MTTWDKLGAPVRRQARSGTAYRFVPGTAGDGHVLAAPASLGYSAAFTPSPVERLEVTGGGWQPGQGQVTVTFLAVPLRR